MRTRRWMAVMAVLGVLGGACSSSAEVEGAQSGGPCDTAADCGPDEWCEATCLDSHGCSDVCPVEAPVEGNCVPRPADCEGEGTQVARSCGCDGVLYASPCHAQLAGVRPSVSTSYCPAPPGEFACGGAYCSASDRYCLVTVLGALGSTRSCEPIPAACVGPPLDCECLKTASVENYASVGSCSSCESSGEGIEVVCAQ